MAGWLKNLYSLLFLQQNETKSTLAALDRVQAVIEFDMDGNIVFANKNFLELMGYSLEEIRGQHHRIFVDTDFAKSAEYRQFWETLNRGEFTSAEYKRIAKGGKEIWIQASYNPIFNASGKPYKVVKFAIDVTAQKLKNADYSAQIEAIGKSQAVIEFDMDGSIINANENFLQTMGYRLDEIRGQHHRIFVDSVYGNSFEYRDFWDRLNRGEHQSAEYRRIGKGGKDVWIQASYNPILDLNRKPIKVVKYATDITREKLIAADYFGQIDAIGKSQAVIEFNVDGTIINANENFLQVMDYRLDEIRGRHHRMFVDVSVQNDYEYKEFWRKLNHGEYQAGEFKRLGKGGREVWIQASYNPIFDLTGKPFKVVKYATNITQEKLKNADYSGQISAIAKSQAVIEFNTDGTVITANDNFLHAMGYRLDEIRGQHHRMFVDSDFRNSREYAQFWERLKRGEYQAAEYKRLGKGGREVWIQASYNPILDLNGKPFKIVKYATDVTDKKRALQAISSCLLALSKGNLSVRVDGEYQGEFNDLKIALNSTMERLDTMIRRILTAADEVSVSANQINAGNLDLSQRAEEQASSLEETAASMEEMTASVQQSANDVLSVQSIAAAAKTSAEQGNQSVTDSIFAMEKIGDSSRKIAEIITTIDEIAFQTNLLALNAAVEAARAGEQGRGFAVVAAEVRVLAQRCAGASKQIRDLIKDSVDKVESGAQLVKMSGNSLRDIVESVAKVSAKINDISTAAYEQRSGIEQVNLAVTQMDTMTQQNAALVEETSAATMSLVEQMNKMKAELSFFSEKSAH